MKFNLIIIFTFFVFFTASKLSAQQHQKPLGFDLSAGVQTFYAPFLKADVKGMHPEEVNSISQHIEELMGAF